jgi:AcrR family transcriptional regulator
MVIKRKKKLNVKTRTRDLIIDEAERMIGEYGLDGLKLDEIALTLGIKRPSLYTHFEGRDGILEAVAERAFIHLSHQFQDDENPDPSLTINRGVQELVKFLSDHKAYARILARDFSTPGGLPAVNAILGPMEIDVVPIILEPLIGRLDKILRRGQKLGKFKKIDSYPFLTIVLGAVMACLLQHRQDMKNVPKMITNLAHGLITK